MEIIKTNIPSVLIIELRVFKDSRSYFFESFSQREFDEPTNEARAESNMLELCLTRRKTILLAERDNRMCTYCCTQKK